MRRYWIDKKQIDSQSVVIFSGDQFHHIFEVCRQELGHHFEVITDDSKAYLVEVIEVNKKTAKAKIIEERMIQQLAKPLIHLALSVPRYHVFDSTLERCVELGVASVQPFVSDYSFIRKESELPAGKYDRWSKIIVSATQQCGRGELMKVLPMVNFKTLIQKVINPTAQKWCLFAYEGQNQLPIHVYLENMREKYASTPEEIWILVGSEGGFSQNEVKAISELGLNPVTLGQQILRVETACLTLVSVLKYKFELMK